MSKTKTTGLAAVQNLYSMQFELLQYMNSGLRTPKQVQEAKQCLQKFTVLLKTVDPQYMGGEDVLEALHAMHGKMSDRVKKYASKTSTKKTAPKKVAAKKSAVKKVRATKKPAKKVTKKKK